MEILHEISDQDVQKLLECLKKKLPDSIVIFNWISTQMVWKAKCPCVRVKILCPDGDWSKKIVVGLSEGTAASNKVFGVAYAPENQLDILKEALTKTNLVPWDRLAEFSASLKRFLPILTEILDVKGFKITKDAIVASYVYYMPAESAVNAPLPELPENVRVSKLDVSLLDTICDNWRSYTPEYRPVIAKNLELNSSIGVFVKDDQGHETLASMVMHAEYGGIGVMQTLPDFRRKGYGVIALAHIAKAFGEKGLYPYGNIFDWNDISVSLFKKCGFSFLSDAATVYIRKK